MCSTQTDGFETLPKLHPERIVETLRAFMSTEWASLHSVGSMLHDHARDYIAASVLSL
jgi:hypothetical protein